MKIKLLVARAGVRFSQSVGEIIEVENAEALRMVAAGQAVTIQKKNKEFAFKKKVSETRA